LKDRLSDMESEKQTILSRFDEYGKELKRDHEAHLEKARKDFQAKVKALQDRELEAREELDRERMEVEETKIALE
jgi:Skp family chaperone for outer membrane proteins